MDEIMKGNEDLLGSQVAVTPVELLLTTKGFAFESRFGDGVLLYLTCMSYQYLHTLWLRGQLTHMTHNDLYSINVIVLINNVSFDREQV